MKYKIYAALREDINSGWIWVSTPELRQRSVISISNPNNGKKIYCEVLRIDDNFTKFYNSREGGRLSIQEGAPTLVINEWYRKLLGDLSTKSEYDLQISSADTLIGKLRASAQHPQIIVRVAFWLGLISVVLGLVGLILGIMSFC